MKDRYRELSGFTPENESDIMLRLRVLAGELYEQAVYADFINRQLSVETAQGEYLDGHAAMRGLSRKAGTKASGEVVFTAAEQEHDTITIPQGTVVCTASDGLRFITDENVDIPYFAGSAAAAVTAAEVGSAYNIGAGTIGVVMTPVMGVGGVTNNEDFSGGSDTESDDALRQRVINSYREISNGTNAAYYRSIAMETDGVYSATVVGGARGAGTVDVYVCGQGTPPDQSVLTSLQAKYNEARELNVDVRVQLPTAVSVNLYIGLVPEDGYNITELADTVKSKVRDYITMLGVGQDFLLSNVGEILYHTPGVADYKFQETYGGNRTITDSEYAVPGDIFAGNI